MRANSLTLLIPAVAIVAAALFAFRATKIAAPPDDLGPPAQLDRGYDYHRTADDFLADARLHNIRIATAVIPTSTTVPPGYALTFDEPSCKQGFTAVVELIPQPDGTVNVWLEELRSNCSGPPMRNTRVFDVRVAKPLGLTPVRFRASPPASPTARSPRRSGSR